MSDEKSELEKRSLAGFGEILKGQRQNDSQEQAKPAEQEKQDNNKK